MRHSDQSKPRELPHSVNCYNCQRKSKEQVKTFYGTQPNTKYQGNLPIKKEVPKLGQNGAIYYVTTCLTGKYEMKFGNFCSVKCGLIWANNEIERRRQQKKDLRNSGEGIKMEDQYALRKFRDNIRKDYT